VNFNFAGMRNDAGGAIFGKLNEGLLWGAVAALPATPIKTGPTKLRLEMCFSGAKRFLKRPHASRPGTPLTQEIFHPILFIPAKCLKHLNQLIG